MLTEEKYTITFDQDVNQIKRNSNCTFGGDEIDIFFTNPREEEVGIVGIFILLTPYIPKQYKTKSQYFKQHIIEEEFRNFDKNAGIKLTLNIIPEYSYLVSAAYKTRFGILSPSENFSLPGEFEAMMKNVGCFIRNDYYIENKTIIYPQDNSPYTAIDCAIACHENVRCIFGWAFQLATKNCSFYHHNIKLEKLQPNNLLMEHEKHIGWVSGLKSCRAPGKFL